MDAVIHMATLRITACAAEPREAFGVMCDGSFNVIEAAQAAGVKKVIAASSASIYGAADDFPTREDHHPYNNRTWYGASKIMLEGLLRSFHDMYGLPYVALRYFNVYGPRMDVYGKYTGGFDPPVDGASRRRPTSADPRRWLDHNGFHLHRRRRPIQRAGPGGRGRRRRLQCRQRRGDKASSNWRRGCWMSWVRR